MNKRPESKRGFTLIEVVIVTAIIAILMSIVMVSLSAVRLKAQTTQGLTDIQEIALYLETYKANYGTYPLSCGTGNSWASRNANPWGCGLGACWIPPLGGEGWCPLPFNTYSVAADGRDQYFYYSDVSGTNYKLLNHSPVSMAVPAEFIDPSRPTWAYGIWTPWCALNC
ncbi:MAG: prepilin-type N-terminal cleavage/methylation domain-containing protein [Candidatus Moraniibacteriota bacterium]